MIDAGGERWRRLTVKEGWRRFVADEPTEDLVVRDVLIVGPVGLKRRAREGVPALLGEG